MRRHNGCGRQPRHGLGQQPRHGLGQPDERPKRRWIARRAAGYCTVAALCSAALMWCSPAVAFAASTAAAQQPQTIRVLSYNIHFGVGLDGRYDLARIGAAIEHAHPDIVGLQEVDVCYDARTHFDDQVRLLAAKLHLHAYFAPMYDWPPYFAPLYANYPQAMTRRRQSGVVVLSRFQIVAAHNYLLSRYTTEEPRPQVKLERGFAEATVQVGNQRLPVFVTHLDAQGDKRVRFLQVTETMCLLRDLSGPMLLLGDLNASPWEPEMAPLLTRFEDALRYCRGQCYAYPANKPRSRVDYVLATPDVQVLRAQVLAASGSDHRPVLAVLALPQHRSALAARGR